MFRAVARIMRTPDLRRKIGFTLGIIALFRLGSFIPAPFVDYQNVQLCLAGNTGTSGLYELVNLFSGGALLQLSVFALGIMPYITSSIIVQLLRVVIPHFDTLYKEGQSGQAKLTQYTRYLTIALGILQSTTLITVARSGALFSGSGAAECSQLITNDAWYAVMLMVITMTAGTGLIMWMGELITERGIGNGMSLLIFTSIAARFPTALWSIAQARGFEIFLMVIAVGLVIMAAVVFVEQSQRRIPVQYAKRMVGRRTYGGNNTYIPIKVNMAGVVPVIFASSLLYLPALVAQFNQPADGTAPPAWVSWVQANLTSGDNPLYMLVYFALIVGFTYFYVAITFNPEEVADNMKKYGGFIPGIRAGRPTAEYLDYVLTRVTLPGALYLGIIALIPLIALATVGANQNFPFGGASILIIVGVGLETVKQIDSQLQQRHYEGLLR
ncbi:preprotein translocase subunit SecY [Frigoribacterium sp. CFBP9039]|uniref:preprotein translocase subunit SecY n=1 Tax=Frigoribacterium TaxID=96492 RepID=UPI001781791A|nr:MULTISPECIES: preprotein translocase subunit SecY [Frigoribacterium]MBD8704185.1 preprotein translocase subunit SecY [Frigoribacterium sp. CFBP 13712]MCJ0700407.1 preprotein translocase subunit SecY [Frigoribacterium faeni]MDY0892591.1 preprotein translocase subunit SecY [Frigoribacterium sp. CFBP9030]MDY0945446.1 preprotein translocase subunit SecY [Frigoribacterium sp. CFBP9039]